MDFSSHRSTQLSVSAAAIIYKAQCGWMLLCLWIQRTHNSISQLNQRRLLVSLIIAAKGRNDLLRFSKGAGNRSFPTYSGAALPAFSTTAGLQCTRHARSELASTSLLYYRLSVHWSNFWHVSYFVRIVGLQMHCKGLRSWRDLRSRTPETAAEWLAIKMVVVNVRRQLRNPVK